MTQQSSPSQVQSTEAIETDSGSGLELVASGSASMRRSFNHYPTLVMSEDDLALDPTKDGHFIIMKSMTTTAAFTCIATMLNLACTQETGFNISAIICNLPPPLQPTTQQQLIPHKPYVDMVPWSSMRDRLLISPTAINDQEFVADMAGMKVWGATPWDPTGWEVSPEFARKWWFLVDDGVLRTTNFWRAQRGEEALVPSSF